MSCKRLNFGAKFLGFNLVLILVLSLGSPAFGSLNLQDATPTTDATSTPSTGSESTPSKTTDQGSSSGTTSSKSTTETTPTGPETTETRTNCPPDSHPEGLSCVPNQQPENKPNEITCPPEQHPEGDKCVPNQRPVENVPIQNCPPGSHFEGPNCVPDQIPPGCTSRIDPNTHAFSVVCENVVRQQCPPDDILTQAENQCKTNKGNPIRSTEGVCPSVRCDFSGLSQVQGNIGFIGNIVQPQQQRNACPTEEQNKEALDRCAQFPNSEGRIINQGGCNYATCVEKRQECPRPNPVEIQKSCGNRGVVQKFVNNCPVFECGQGGQQPTRFSENPPPEAYTQCANQHEGSGELVLANGKWRCIGPSNRDESEAVKPAVKVPDKTKLLQVALQLEQLKVELDKLSVQSDEIAEYWKGRGKAGDEGRFRRIADMFEAANKQIEEVKTQIRDNLNSLTIEKTIEFQQNIQGIKEGILNDILYLMLSQSDDVKQQVETKLDDASAKQFREKRKVEFQQKGFGNEQVVKQEMEDFNKNFKTCNAYSFTPSGDQFGPTITIIGLENDACVVKAQLNNLPPGIPEDLKSKIGSPPYSMECRFTDYALGMKDEGPGDEKIKQCSGNMLKLKEFSGQQGGKGFGNHPINGPGGCKSMEECQAYCKDHEKECKQFGGGPQGFGGPENFQGPGGCKGPQECQAYCQKNPQECQGFFGGQGFGGPQGGFDNQGFNGQNGGFGGQGFNGPGGQNFGDPRGGFQSQPQAGPGGCTNQQECTAYCSNPIHASECGMPPGGGGFGQQPNSFQNNQPIGQPQTKQPTETTQPTEQPQTG